MASHSRTQGEFSRIFKRSLLISSKEIFLQKMLNFGYTFTMIRFVPFLLLTLSIGTCAQAQTQIQAELSEVLAAHDFSQLQAYAEGVEKKHKKVRVLWELSREVTVGFSESVLIVEESTPHPQHANVFSLAVYRVKLITKGSVIIFFEFGEVEETARGEMRWARAAQVERYQHAEEYGLFELSFKELFQAPLNAQDLFKSTVVYGESCGFAGQDPEERIQMEIWVDRRDKASLMKWLQSPCTEIQMYAVEGLHALYQDGVSFTWSELRMIAFVQHKSGQMIICSGCVFTDREIKEVGAQFVF